MQRISRRRYTDDFKAQAVALAESIGPAKASSGNWICRARRWPTSWVRPGQASR